MEKWGRRDQKKRILRILGCPREADGLPCGCGVGTRARGDSNREGSPMARGYGLPGSDGWWVILKDTQGPAGIISV